MAAMNGHGGSRKNSGRPLGAKNKIPRDVERLKAMILEAERSEYLYSNDVKEFDGNCLDFIRAVVRCEHLPVKIRLYAATKGIDYEAAFEQRLKELADAERQQCLDAEAKAHDLRIDNEISFVQGERDAELRELIAAGDVSPRAGAIIRGWWVLPTQLLLPPPSQGDVDLYRTGIKPDPPTTRRNPFPAPTQRRRRRQAMLRGHPSPTLLRYIINPAPPPGSTAASIGRHHRRRARSSCSRARTPNIGATAASRPTSAARSGSPTPGPPRC
jgi:hypothetical protein